MYAVPKAEYMLRHPEKYTDEEKFAFAMKLSLIHISRMYAGFGGERIEYLYQSS